MATDAQVPSGRSIRLRSWAVLMVIAFGVALSCFLLLYHRNLEARTVQLEEMAKSQARLMEAVGKFNAFFQSGEVVGAARSATLSQIKEGHRKYTGFGETGELVLAERVGSEIVFLLPTRKRGFRVPRPMPMDGNEAGPTALALGGGSGVIQAYDHSGEEVLAAYEWLPFLEMSLVCKIDMVEIKAPFRAAALWTAAIATILLLLGFYINGRMVTPLVSMIVANAEIIREREARHRALVSSIPGAVFRSRADDRRTMLELSEPIEGLTGHAASEFLGGEGVAYTDIIHADDADIFRRGASEVLEPGKTFKLEYRIRRADGEVRWISEWGTVVEDAEGQALLEGVMLDVTDRKVAEAALAELPVKLSRYLSPQVYQSIFEGDQDVRVGSSRKKLTVFFSDIVNFTAKSDTLDPEDLSYIINAYLNRMALIAIEHGGTLDKFIGDGILIFFGDPESRGIEEDARACVRMGLAMQSSLDALSEDARRHGVDTPLSVRMGIATGYCTVGNFGSESRMDYTVLGKTVNLASRLESAAVPGTINVSRETWVLVRDEFECDQTESVALKGFDQPVEVFRVRPATSAEDAAST